MKSLTSFQTAFLGLGSVVASTFAFSAPAQAAALSRVISDFQASFFIPPIEGTLLTDTVADSVAIGEHGKAVGQANALSEIVTDSDTEAEGLLEVSVVNDVAGNGEFTGFTDTSAFAASSFWVYGGETFSFDFSGNFLVETEVTDTSEESAFGESTFSLFVNDDFIDIIVSQNTPGSSFLFENTQGNFNFSFFEISEIIQDSIAFTSIKFAGEYSRTFEEKTFVDVEADLVGSAFVASAVKVPAPGVLCGIFLLGGLGLSSQCRKLQVF